MKTILFLFVSLFIFTASLFSQSHLEKRASVWYFGQTGAGLDFKCNPPKPIKGGMYYTIEGCAAISDTLGNILFYTNGDTVYNKSHEVMSNGFGIGNLPNCYGSSAQGALIVPQPDHDSNYYIFTVDCADDLIPNDFNYSIVDMAANGGLGEVTTKHNLLKTPVTEKLAAVHHANGKDIWVVIHEHGTDAFYSYLVTAAGLNPVPIVSYTGQVHTLPTFPESMSRGYMKFSPNGERLIVLSISDQHNYGIYPEMFSFDDATGQVTLDYTIVDLDSTNYYGATFSPDNNLLYLSSGWKGGYVHQFDANATDVTSFWASKQEIFTTTTYAPSALQIGPDGKIYIATARWWIDVIHHPNIYGLGCGYQSEAIYLYDCPDYTQSLHGLPNYPESYFRSTTVGEVCLDTIAANFSFTDACKGAPCFFVDNTYIVPDTTYYWSWDFGDPASGPDNLSSLQNPSHIFATAGNYEVKLVITTNPIANCKMDVFTTTVNVEVCTGTAELIAPPPSINSSPNPFQHQTVLSLNNVQNSDIYIRTMTGSQIRHIRNEGQQDLKIDFGQDLPTGIYLLTVQTMKGVWTEKLIKMGGN